MTERILGLDIGIASLGWAVIDYNREDRSKNRIVKSGVRLFTKAEHPKDGSSLALPRREARGARRTIKRKRQRMKKIKYLFVHYFGLTKEDLFVAKNREDKTIYTQRSIAKKNRQDVWELRDKALNEILAPIEFARVLTHIAKRRGYLSNSKVEEEKQSDKGAVKAGIIRVKSLLANEAYKTIGSAIYNETKDTKVRRNHPISKRDKEGNVVIKDGELVQETGYQFVATRKLLEDEAKSIFEAQRELGSKIAIEELEEKYLEFFNKQLPIAFDEKMIGKCTFEPKEDKAPRRAYASEEFIAIDNILKTSLFHKETGEIRQLISFVSIKDIFKELHGKKSLTYKALRSKFNVDDFFMFNTINYVFDPEKKTKFIKKLLEKEEWLSDEQRVKIKKRLENKDKKGKLKTYLDLRYFLKLEKHQEFSGVKYNQNPEEIVFAKLDGYHDIKKAFEGYEAEFKRVFEDRDTFNKIADILARKKDDKLRKEQLSKLNINNEVIEKLLVYSFAGFIRYSFKALNKIRPYLFNGFKNHEALVEVYGHHSHGLKKITKQKYLRGLNDDEKLQITSPVAKRSIAQTRKLINAIVRDEKTFGKIDKIHIELAREIKNSKKRRDEIQQGQNDYRNEKEIAKKELLEHIANMRGCALSENDKGFSKLLLKYRLHRQQGGQDVYQWKDEDSVSINISRLIEDENYCQIDHILPQCRSFDNSLNNQVLTLTHNNQNKSDLTPFEWIANENEECKAWKRFEVYINAFMNIKSAKRKKLLKKSFPKRRGDKISTDDIENYEDSFIARNLIDVQTTARFLKNFIEQNLILGENNGKQKVFTRNGMLTSSLRYQWGINNKNRDNNYHHAEDAIIIAFATQGEVQRLSTISASEVKYNLKKINIKKEPLDNFRGEVQKSIDDIFVSFAPRKKMGGEINSPNPVTVNPKKYRKYIENHTKLFALYKKEKQKLKKSEEPKEPIDIYMDNLIKKESWISKEQRKLIIEKRPSRFDDLRNLLKLDKDFEFKSIEYRPKETFLLRGGSVEKGEVKRIDVFKKDEKYFFVPIYPHEIESKKIRDLNVAISTGKYKDYPNEITIDDSFDFKFSLFKNDLTVVKQNANEALQYVYFSQLKPANGQIFFLNHYDADKKKPYSMYIHNIEKIEKYAIDILGNISENPIFEKRLGTKLDRRLDKKG
jgi:CRISPR-associated endonuclease Csn1